MKQAIGYVRVSTEEQARGGVSLAAQEKSIRTYCELRGFDLVDLVVDAGVSAGKRLATRPGGSTVANMARRGKVDAVVSYKLDLLFRNAADCLDQTAAWDKANVSLHLIDMGGQAVDTSTAMGRFFLTVMAGAAEMERGLVSERTIVAMAHKRDRGERISGQAPFGYTFDGDDLIENLEEQAVLLDLHQLRRDGMSFQKIADELARRGVMTRTGRPYTSQGIGHLYRTAKQAND